MTVFIEEVIDRINEGQNILEIVESVFWPFLRETTNLVIKYPIATIIVILILGYILKTRKR